MAARIQPLDAWPLAGALALLATFQAALGLAMLRVTGWQLIYPLDDTYIQMAIAKTLATHGVWGVTRYEFSGAGTSLLWPLILAAVDRLAGTHEWWPLIINAVFAGVTVVLAFLVIRRHLASRSAQFTALAVLIVAAPLPALTLVGMEHSLECAMALALTIAGVELCARQSGRSDRARLGLTLTAAFLTVAVRPDAAAVLVPLTIVILITRGWMRAGAVALAGAAPLAVYALVAWRHGWPALPASILLKQRLGHPDPSAWHRAADVLGGGALTVLVNTPALFVLVLLAVALTIVCRRYRDEPRALQALYFLIVFTGATLVHAQFGRLGWLYRYEAYLVVLGVTANAIALAQVFRLPRPALDTVQWAALALFSLLVVQPLVLRGFLAARDTLRGAGDVYRHEYQWGRFFRLYPPDGGLLLNSLGVLAYVTDVPIVDPSGLATLELLEPAMRDAVDLPSLFRAAGARGVRVAMLGNASRHTPGWQCVAVWTVDQDSAGAITLLAADAPGAARLQRNLTAFADGDRQQLFSLSFAKNGSADCPGAAESRLPPGTSR